MAVATSLRERKKMQVCDALVAEAERLFLRQGFDATTVDEIADAADVSRRTFFRYFESKEAVVFPERAALLARFKRLLRERPKHESGFAAVRQATLVLAQDYMRDRERVLRQFRIVTSSPALIAYELELDRDFEAAIAEAFRVREGTSAAARWRARVCAGALMGVIRATLRQWFESEVQADLVRLGQDAFDLVEQGMRAETSAK